MRRALCALGVAIVSACGDSSGTADARIFPDAIVIDAVLPFCSVVTQNCPDPNQKCTIFNTANGLGQPACEPNGTLTQNAPCTIGGDAPTGDDCLKGNLCTRFGGGFDGDGGLKRLCRPLCMSDPDCAPPQRCFLHEMFTAITPPPAIGSCGDACAVFGTDCGAGATCDIEWTFPPGGAGLCRPTGTTAVGDPCTSLTDCVSDATCLGAPTTSCRQMCPLITGAPGPHCPAGLTCTSIITNNDRNPPTIPGVGVCI